MIPVETLGIRPFRERDLLPVATDAQAIEYFQRQLEFVRSDVAAAIRFHHPSRRRILVHISGAEKYSLVGGDSDSRIGKPFPKLRVEKGNAQNLLLKAMEAYGFDPTKKIGDPNMSERPDGTTRESIVYKSQTINGLVFERTRDFNTRTEQPIDVWWQVGDQSGGFSVDIKNVLRRSPRPEIKLD